MQPGGRLIAAAAVVSCLPCIATPAPILQTSGVRQAGPIVLRVRCAQVGYCLEAASKLEKDGISAEVINLRSIKPLDRDTIINSVKKTHR